MCPCIIRMTVSLKSVHCCVFCENIAHAGNVEKTAPIQNYTHASEVPVNMWECPSRRIRQFFYYLLFLLAFVHMLPPGEWK